MIVAMVLRRSRVDRAKDEPCQHEHVAGVDLVEHAAKLGAVAFAPLAVSRHIFRASAPGKGPTRASTL